MKGGYPHSPHIAPTDPRNALGEFEGATLSYPLQRFIPRDAPVPFPVGYLYHNVVRTFVKTRILRIRVPESLKEQVKARAAETRTSESWIVREALWAYCTTPPR